ncbi:hypothetical protein KP509_11G033700 [Ceratopteris richardii]|uniref:Uncharacterized protein n=1 Tax=Ceratopteris richardii TaxID=49495 RepID=A0A8T2TT99_CERRI|nr:hypothetical protein KP509_11G033700 [Ceratopteris richardii]
MESEYRLGQVDSDPCMLWNCLTSRKSATCDFPKSAFLGASIVMPGHTEWFDVRVFYVRASSCVSNKAPDSLLIVYPQRSIYTELEVNGCRISPSERACFVLRRDRVDAGAAEATYVSTNSMRTSGDLQFEIYDKDELIVYGTLGRVSLKAESELDKESVTSLSCQGNEGRWSMGCSCGITSHSSFFLKGRVDFSTVYPTMEVYVAGHSLGSPLALTTTVPLNIKRSSLRKSSLGAISEVDESQPDQILEKRDKTEVATFSEMENIQSTSSSFFMPIAEAYMCEGDEGDLSWFNAGVRVGVGIGLGLCLGIGLGLGLLVRPSKRRIL